VFDVTLTDNFSIAVSSLVLTISRGEIKGQMFKLQIKHIIVQIDQLAPVKYKISIIVQIDQLAPVKYKISIRGNSTTNHHQNQQKSRLRWPPLK